MYNIIMNGICNFNCKLITTIIICDVYTTLKIKKSIFLNTSLFEILIF